MGNLPLERLMVFTGNANPRLAQDVVKCLNIALGRAVVGRFSDGEVMVEILENVRGKDVFVLQSICVPTNDSLMELMIMVDALKRASAGRITAAMPYFGYARQDRRPRSARTPPRSSAFTPPRARPAGRRSSRSARRSVAAPAASAKRSPPVSSCGTITVRST